MSATTHDGADLTDIDSLLRGLDAAYEDRKRARERVREVGEPELDRLADAYDDLTDLFDRYEERVTGDGDFKTFIEFQGKVASFTEELDADLRHREVFEDVDDLLQQRRLTEGDWAEVRETLAPVREDVNRLTERADAERAYREARSAIDRRLSKLRSHIGDLETLVALGAADLDAPTERLRDPIETYNERVRDAFESFRREASAREVLDFVAATEQYPLVDFRSPPDDLHDFVRSQEVGTEPIPQLLEYADYSRSKLDHYVADADALKRNVATQRTYLRRLDADPLTVDWPPPPAETLTFRGRELTSVVARFAGDDVLETLRAVRRLPTETDYERLRESARARDQLTDAERERLAAGDVSRELEACRTTREELEAVLEEYPEP